MEGCPFGMVINPRSENRPGWHHKVTSSPPVGTDRASCWRGPRRQRL